MKDLLLMALFYGKHFLEALAGTKGLTVGKLRIEEQGSGGNGSGWLNSCLRMRLRDMVGEEFVGWVFRGEWYRSTECVQCREKQSEVLQALVHVV